MCRYLCSFSQHIMSRISSATIDTFLYTKYEVREDVAAAFVCLEQSRSDTLTVSRNASSEIQSDISLFAALTQWQIKIFEKIRHVLNQHAFLFVLQITSQAFIEVHDTDTARLLIGQLCNATKQTV